MLQQATLKGSRNVIFSQGSAVGHTPCALPVFQTLSRAGREVRRASLSVWLAQASGKEIHVTWLQPFSISSVSVDLQQSLGSRLQTQLKKITGLTVYSLNWKKKVTPAGLPYYQHVASRHRTSETASSLVRAPSPTPTASDSRGSGKSVIRKDGRVRTFDRLDYATEQGMKGALRRVTRDGVMLTGLNAVTENSGQLNPAHSRWLMGFPPEWDDCAVMAMQ
ncbi:hypothetical protein D3C76_908940 [compost metagenome]